MLDYKKYPEISCIYSIYNLIDNKMYIGSTINLNNRIKRHKYYLINNKHHSLKLQRAFNKYGLNYFSIKILKSFVNITTKELIQEESEFIKKYNSIKNGYNNLEPKYYSSFTQSTQAIENFKKVRSFKVLSINRFDNNDLQLFNSISEASKYYKTSSSNISRVCKNKLNHIKGRVFVYLNDFNFLKDYRVLQHHMKNVVRSEELIEKMKNNKREIKVIKYDMNKSIIKVYRSIRECEKQENFPLDTLRYKLLTPFGGYFYNIEN